MIVRPIFDHQLAAGNKPHDPRRLSKAGRQSKAAEATNLNLYVNLAPLCFELT